MILEGVSRVNTTMVYGTRPGCGSWGRVSGVANLPFCEKYTKWRTETLIPVMLNLLYSYFCIRKRWFRPRAHSYTDVPHEDASCGNVTWSALSPSLPSDPASCVPPVVALAGVCLTAPPAARRIRFQRPRHNRRPQPPVASQNGGFLSRRVHQSRRTREALVWGENRWLAAGLTTTRASVLRGSRTHVVFECSI